MIRINESIPKKVVGLTSLYITFDYKNSIVDLLKTCDGSHYDKKSKVWEVPVTNLSYILDSLILIDDIELKLLKDKKPTKYYKYCPVEDPNGIKMFDHQKEAVEFGLQENHKKWLLLDAPGLGKTLTIIRLAEELKKRDNIEHCFIVCGINTLKTNWKKEIEKFSNEKARIIGQYVTPKGKIKYMTIPKRVEQLKQKLDEFFIIINIESLRDENIIKAIQKGPNKYDMIAFDEFHKCKNSGAQQSENLLKLKAQYQIGMTGTLILNNPMDCYVPLKWIGCEHASQAQFKYYYTEYGGPFGTDFVGYRNMGHLKTILNQHSLRRTKDLLNLPPKNIIDEFVEMEPTQEQFYDNVRKGIRDQVDKVKLTPGNLLAMVTRLRQATDLPNILTTENIPSAKVERCVDLCEQILSDPNEKVVIFSVFKETLNYISHRLIQYNPLVCHGDIPDEIVSRNIDEFQNNNFNRVLICTTQKMGTGVTLNRAHYSIFISSEWTAGVQEQCEDRIHRLNNDGAAFIYRLWTKDTFDERNLYLINLKGAISDYIVDDKVSVPHYNLLKQFISEI